MDIGEWLRGLGLGRYETVFCEHAIGIDVLADVTDGELAQIGVRLGDRKRLLKAIASLRKMEPSSLSKGRAAPAIMPATPIPMPPAAGGDAERRPITVLFCDLVGSTSIVAKLDAEDWRNLIGPYLDKASAAVIRFGGRVQDRLGDGLMALFGYPQAQENDAERAVRAALAIERALDDLNAKNTDKDAPRLVARIGLESGQVVVDVTGAIFGEAPNVAARVQSLAEPGSVIVTAEVQRQISGLFVAEDRGLHELKGVQAPVALYRIVRASGGGRRSGGRAMTPLVGREEELERLGRHWERARSGEGQLVIVVGEPGIGKSRLIQEFHAQLGEMPHTWVEWSSSQLLQNTPLHPIVEWGRLRFGDADAPDGQRLTDLDNALRSVGLDAAEYAPLLALLVESPLTEDRPARFAPEELRRRQLAAITAWVLAGARTQPVVLAFEDLHWADPTSLDLMRALAERGAQEPLLVIATTRPEFRPPWSVSAHHSVVSLSPLDRGQVALMVSQLATRHALSPDVVEGVSERSGGVPLFVEEVTRLLLERRVEGGAPAIPPTLQQSLAARLDRLGPAREIAQIGAVLGRDFPYALLEAVADLEEAELRAALERLTEANILFIEGDGPRPNYRFKHVLIQDAAYEMLLKSRRRALHRRAAELLSENPERAAAEPEVIARHFTEAGLDGFAIEWWGKAGDQALRRSAFQEAIAHLGKAIGMADKADAAAPAAGGPISASPPLTQLHVAYGNALIAARGYAAPETTEAFARARESASGDKDASEKLAAIYGLWLGGYVRGELPSMRAQVQAFLDEVAARPPSPEAAVAHRIAGITCWFAGGYREARAHFEKALETFQPGRDDDLAFRFGFDPGVGAMGYLAFALWPLGEVDRAISLINRMQRRAAEIPHAGTLAFARNHSALFEMMRGDPARAEPNASELARLAREHKLTFFGASAAFLEGWVKENNGAPGGLEEMRRAMEQVREQKVLTFLDLGNIALAEAEARAGDLDRACALLEEALATDECACCRAFEAELHRAHGEILLQCDSADPARAEHAFLAAIMVAKQQGARSFELRAAFSLAKLYQSTDRLVEAHAVLAPALEGFAPTPEMPVIAKAQTLLAALAETEAIKAGEGQRQQRLRLQTAYGEALMYSKGYAAEETKAAFARAADLVVNSDESAERFSASYGQCLGHLLRSEYQEAEDIARRLLHEAEAAKRRQQTARASNLVGQAFLYQGKLFAAQSAFERALAEWRLATDSLQPLQPWIDTGVMAESNLAHIAWLVGEPALAQQLSEQAIQRANVLGHAQTSAQALLLRCLLETLRDNAAAAHCSAELLLGLARERGMELYATFGGVYSAWARSRLSSSKTGAAELRQAIADYVKPGNKTAAPLFLGLLAQRQADAQDVGAAIATIDEALARSSETDEFLADAFLHRIRGDILLKRDPVDIALAEDAYRTAVAIAKQQGARSYELLASLSLAKVYQSTGRAVEAQAVLAPALKGFAPTPEMLEIAEAQALMERLA